MHILEIDIGLKCSGAFLWGHRGNGCVHVSKDATLLQSDLAITKVVKDGMDAGNDAACVVEHVSLLHVVVIGDGGVATLSVLLLLEELSVDDHSEDRGRDECEEILLEAIDLTEVPFVG